ncbi:MAG: hypothetical protein ACOYO1_03085 [Bacteroidales bacterium]
MVNYIKNLIVLPTLYRTFNQNIKFQRKFIATTIQLDIDESKNYNDNSLDENDFKKITDYYGLAVPAILGEFYSILRGKRMSDRERMILTYLGGLTGLFDDFFDKKDLEESYILQLIDNPFEINGNNSNEKLFLNFYRKALELSNDVDLLKSNFRNVFKAQQLSKKQSEPEISRNEITSITFEKGGLSMLFYWSVFEKYLNENDDSLFYKLGCIGQLENDIFDVYKDYKDGVKTLVTTETKITNLSKIYFSLLDEIIELLQQTNYPQKNKQNFKQFILIVICRGMVCLDMLRKNEKQTNNVFSIADYKRKDLICDMENPWNFLKTLDYFAKFNI